jgi:hypothetical protein
MAKPSEETGHVSRPADKTDALQLLLEYLLRTGSIAPKDILHGAGLTNEQYQNFRRGKGAKHYPAIAKYIANTPRLKRLNDFPDFVKPLIGECFPEKFAGAEGGLSSPNDIFLKYANLDRKKLREVSETYAGLFSVYRYSSHIDRKPEKLLVQTGQNLEEVKEDPWMIRSAMEIFEAGDDDQFVRFKIHYRPYEKLRGKLSEIDGIIIAIKEVLYFVGLERTRYPVVIMTVPNFDGKIDIFTGMILRYHEYRRTIASRVGFMRAPADVKSINELHKEIGLETESKITEAISEFDRNLINDVAYKGKAALIATD